MFLVYYLLNYLVIYLYIVFICHVFIEVWIYLFIFFLNICLFVTYLLKCGFIYLSLFLNIY